MKKYIVCLILMLASINASAATYNYQALNTVNYYTNGLPSGLTTLETSLFVFINKPHWRYLLNNGAYYSDKEAVKTIMRGDQASLIMPPVITPSPLPRITSNSFGGAELLPKSSVSECLVKTDLGQIYDARISTNNGESSACSPWL